MKRNGHKFNAVRTEVDGITFASKAEARRYAELKMLEKAGKIRSLQLQPKYPIHALKLFDAPVKIGTYIADFRYERFRWPGKSKECETVVEDVKGMKTAVYRLKKKMVEAQYGITITEITR